MEEGEVNCNALVFLKTDMDDMQQELLKEYGKSLSPEKGEEILRRVQWETEKIIAKLDVD